MREDLSRDPQRDPALEHALRELGPEPPMEAVDWDGLQRSVGARALALLARRRRTWWEYAASWAGPAIPATLAACVALVVALVLAGSPDAAPEPGMLAGEPPAMEEVLWAGALDIPFGPLAFNGDVDALLEAAVRWEEP
jgi:hypothetical protein